MTAWSRLRFPLMFFGILSLAAGLWTGLSRIGWDIPEIRAGVLALHGPIMISGFLGTVIGLERAVALDRPWTYLAPLLSATGSIIVIATPFEAAGRLLFVAASIIFACVFAAIIIRQYAAFTVTMGIGSLLWLGGNVLWLVDYPVSTIVSWWAGYLILTIAGERLDLSRLLAPSKSSYVVFFFAIAVFLIGVVLSTFNPSIGTRVLGAGILMLTLWLVKHDIVTRTIRMQGLTRFVAVCLLSGYLWLGAGGLLALYNGELIGGTPMYDAILHSIFVGFVLAMIFGHAPIIFPAVLRVPIIYTNLFYIHFMLLEFSLIIRIVGDVTSSPTLSMWGGLLNVVSLALFLVNTVVGAIRGVLSQKA